MRRRSPLRQRFGGTPAKGDDRGPPFCPNFLQFHGLRAAPSHDDEVDAVRKKSRREAEALSAEALDAVASDGTAHFATHDQPDARSVRHGKQGLRGDEKHKVAGDHPTSLCLDAPEVSLATHSSRAIESRAQGLLLVNVDGKALATLAAAVREDLLPTLRGHSGAEAVRSHAT
jgi:hypothetical protein